jgi:drug/metabolite transporter (DMT)-like permease
MTSPIIIGRAVTFSLGLIQSFTIIYTCATDGSPFRMELLTPWMAATLIDFYVLITLLVGWIWYKESTWARRLIWTALLICFGSVSASWYVAIEFFKLSVDDPIHLVLLKDRHTRWLSSNLLDPSYFTIADEGSQA